MKHENVMRGISCSGVYKAVMLASVAAIAGCGGGDGADQSASTTLLSQSKKIVNGGGSTVVVARPADQCAALVGTTIAVDEFALSTRGAVITGAALQAASAQNGLPEYCQVTGSVLAASLADPPINFQLNLPTTWNQKALQFGGGGFNGVVVTGTGNVNHSPDSTPKPLQKGYMTFGGDSGHTGGTGEFGLNAQALANYSGESVKRTRDVAVAIGKRYYGTLPQRTYYVGGSKGGHEALVAAQRYGADYAGVIAYYPASQNQALVLDWFRTWEAAYRSPGGFLNDAKRQLLKTAVLDSCDALDGVKDGIVANTEACGAAFDVNKLRCPGGQDTGDSCLSDAQIKTLNTAATPMQFAFPLANGVTSNGPYPIYLGGDGSVLFGPVPEFTAYGFLAEYVIRYFIQQNPASTTMGFDYRAWQPRVEQISQMYDASDPNLDVFKANGGKMLIVQGTTDMLVPTAMTTAYFNQVQDRYHGTTKSFVRYFVQPGFGHSTGYFDMKWDSLSALEAWAEQGQAPSNPVAASGQRTLPLCEYPLWPKYMGSGDPNDANSFNCVKK